MAKSNGSSGTTRLQIKTKTMRELMFASGGRCAMTDCGLPLVSPTGGWIGTVAHIVAAEVKGPRGESPLGPDQRREFDNLILMCATHGREVDDPETGEALFPVDRLRVMKQTHESKVSRAVRHAIEQESTGAPTAIGLIDTALRRARSATSGGGLGEAIEMTGPSLQPQLMSALEEARSTLQGLSQLSLETLSQLLALWVMSKREGAGYEFGDPTQAVYLPSDVVGNRVGLHRRADFDASLSELFTLGLLELEEDEWAGTRHYKVRPPWSLDVGYNFWVSAAEFLWAGHSVLVSDWLRGLDFSIFDKVALADRQVPWRD